MPLKLASIPVDASFFHQVLKAFSRANLQGVMLKMLYLLVCGHDHL
jgi:hypothetical protein